MPGIFMDRVFHLTLFTRRPGYDLTSASAKALPDLCPRADRARPQRENRKKDMHLSAERHFRSDGSDPDAYDLFQTIRL